MKVLLQQVIINDPRSPFNGSTKDILIIDGIIVRIADSIEDADARTISAPSLTASPGWVDPFAHFNDPGTEYKETIESGSAAAAAGGFTTVFVLPNTKPAVDSKSQVEYVVAKAAKLPVNIWPIGAVSRQLEGKDLAEMYDMRASGAIAFSDGTNPIQSSGLLVKALLYVKTFDGVVIQLPDDTSIAAHGLMHEGIVSTRLGLQAKPMLAEELIVSRDIELARYTGSHIHFTGVSSPKSIEYIQRAKEAGLKVSCSVTPYHLFFCDEDLQEYDSNLKVNPPLRTRNDMMALRESLRKGHIDCIATHHQPHNYDAKVLEFEYAKFGMISLESCFAALHTAVPGLSPEQIANLFSINARNLFKLPGALIQEGQVADITLYEPGAEIIFTKEMVRSKSSNSPFLDRLLKGAVTGIVNGHHLILNKAL
ncbi:dihydroorotase [Flavihumibacter profundi]|uniref:dihydroorotase n=1 Tax=Flavihumibacter profundi TaxID=2716883 RepID=UPI001CC6892F|nr:dihydroorotase [Flavihumibacter profundi]MBZ5856228.1 dihydroorotase [Flavihumibacter profundi]